MVGRSEWDLCFVLRLTTQNSEMKISALTVAAHIPCRRMANLLTARESIVFWKKTNFSEKMLKKNVKIKM